MPPTARHNIKFFKTSPICALYEFFELFAILNEVEEKQTSYLVTLQSTTTRAGMDRYRELKRETRRFFEQTKRDDAEKREYEELENVVT